jgi:ABC-type phosphate transport system substrate-binding protein
MAALFRRQVLLLFTGSAALVVLPALGNGTPEFRVIAHPTRAEQRVTRDFVADAFLKNITRWPGDQAIRPVDQRPDAHVRRRFSESLLRRSVQAVKTYWQQRIFSGRGVPPPELESDEVVVRYVENTPGAIGYVSAGAALGKTRALALE